MEPQVSKVLKIQRLRTRGETVMDVATGFGMLAVGLIAIAIGGTVAFFIINKVEQNKQEEKEKKEREKVFGG